jgi:hypothetical protein
MEYEWKFVNGNYPHTILKTELPFGLHHAVCESPNLFTEKTPQYSPHHQSATTAPAREARRNHT